jgi:hypothetical protein
LDQLVFANPGGGVLQQLVQLVCQIDRGIEFVVHYQSLGSVAVSAQAALPRKISPG